MCCQRLILPLSVIWSSGFYNLGCCIFIAETERSECEGGGSGGLCCLKGALSPSNCGDVDAI